MVGWRDIPSIFISKPSSLAGLLLSPPGENNNIYTHSIKKTCTKTKRNGVRVTGESVLKFVPYYLVKPYFFYSIHVGLLFFKIMIYHNNKGFFHLK